MKTLLVIQVVVGFMFYNDFEIPTQETLLVKPNPVLVKPQVEYPPLVWVDMSEGVKFYEGYFPKLYICPGSKRTIGYGHTGKGVNRGYVSKDTAHKLLMEDLENARKLVEKNVKVPLTNGQLACLTSFTFNCGVGSLRRLVNGDNRLNSGNYKSIERILPLYRRANGKILKGLVKRRAWELTLWKNDCDLFVAR